MYPLLMKELRYFLSKYSSNDLSIHDNIQLGPIPTNEKEFPNILITSV